VGTLTGVDQDGDPVNLTSNADAGSFVITVVDDIPEIGVPQDALMANETGNSVTGSLNIIGSGADEPASISIALEDGAQVLTVMPLDESPKSFTSDGAPLFWQDNGDGSWSAVTQGDNPNVAFTVSVDETNGTYTVYQNNGVDGADSTATIDFSDALNGGNTYEAVFGPEDATVVTNGDTTTYSDSVFVWARAAADQATPFALPADTETVNYSSSGVGVGAGSMIDGSGPDVPSEDRVSDILSVKFFSEIEVNESGNSQDSVRVNESNSTVLQLTGVNLVLDHLGSAETGYYTLWSDGVQVSDEYSITGLDNGTGSSADQKDDLLQIDVVDGDQTLYAGYTTFDEVRLEAGDNDAYRIESAQVSVYQEGYDETLLIPVDITDADGDTVSTDFSVTFDGQGELDAIAADAADGDVSESGMAISGSSGDDTIIGTDYDDTIYGGDGSDTIDGGDGNDFIVGDIVGETGDDTIDGGAGDDVLIGGDGVDVLSGEEGNDILVGDIVDFEGTDDGGTTPDIIEDSDGDIISGGTGDESLGDILVEADDAGGDESIPGSDVEYVVDEGGVADPTPIDPASGDEVDPLLQLIPPPEDTV
jgi:Ca2+-binding RTX toxin-like protein